MGELRTLTPLGDPPTTPLIELIIKALLDFTKFNPTPSLWCFYARALVAARITPSLDLLFCLLGPVLF